MQTITPTDIAELRQSLAGETISYGEIHLIQCLADDFGLDTGWDGDDPMPYEVVLDEVVYQLPREECYLCGEYKGFTYPAPILPRCSYCGEYKDDSSWGVV